VGEKKLKKKLMLLAVLASLFVFVPAAFAVESNGNAATRAAITTDSLKQALQDAKAARAEQKAQKQQVALDRSKELAKNRIDNIIERFNRIKARVASMKVISADLKTELAAKVDAQVAILTAQKAKVDEATTLAQVKTVMADVKTQVKNSAGIVKQVVAAIHTTHLNNIVTKITEVLDKLTETITQEKESGKDMAAVEKLKTAAEASLEDATTKIKAGDFKAAKTAIVSARQSLVDLAQQLKDATGAEEGVE
jgi:hypothetical protein